MRIFFLLVGLGLAFLLYGLAQFSRELQEMRRERRGNAASRQVSGGKHE